MASNTQLSRHNSVRSADTNHAAAYALVDGLATLEEEDGGDVADAELGGEVGALVDVGGTDDGAAFVLGGDLLDAGCEGFAGTAPGGAEVNHYGQRLLHDGVEVETCHKDAVTDGQFAVFDGRPDLPCSPSRRDARR